MHGVSHDQEQEAAGIAPDQSKGEPSLLTVHNAITDHDVQGIEEYPRGFLKTDAVLALVGEVLSLIPFEPNLWHAIIVVTFMQIYKPDEVQWAQ
jgi:hypothetical protein